MPRSPYAAVFEPLPMSWEPMPPELALAQARLHETLCSWRGTPYMRGQQRKGVGVDCVRFCSAVWDELLGMSPYPIARLPHDAALNKPAVARAFMRHVLHHYAPIGPVEGPAQPGDILVTGVAGAGPGHVILVGAERNTIWQAGQRSVDQHGWALTEGFQVLMHHYRFGNRERWQTP